MDTTNVAPYDLLHRSLLRAQIAQTCDYEPHVLNSNSGRYEVTQNMSTTFGVLVLSEI